MSDKPKARAAPEEVQQIPIGQIRPFIGHPFQVRDDELMKPEAWNITLPIGQIKKYFPKSYTPKQMEATIFKLLEGWQKKRERQNER